jgi:Spherulation-specific family 4
MHFPSLFNTFFFLLLSQVLTATKIIVPLYSYPTDPEWATFEASVAQYPALDFLVVINPNNGPGSATPDPDFVTGITQLGSYPNVNIVGYILTSYGAEDVSDIQDQVSMYAAWPSDVRVSGIFFDEIAEDNVPYYTSVADSVRSAISDSIVVFNPGTTCSTAYFEFVDEIMIFEDSYPDYGGDNVPSTNLPTGQSSILIYSMPSDVLETFVTEFVGSGYASLYLTDDPATYDTLGTGWDLFCSLVNEANGGKSTTPTTSSAAPPAPPVVVKPTPTTSKTHSIKVPTITSAAPPPPPAVVAPTPVASTFITIVSSAPQSIGSGRRCHHRHCHHHHYNGDRV